MATSGRGGSDRRRQDAALSGRCYDWPRLLISGTGSRPPRGGRRVRRAQACEPPGGSGRSSGRSRRIGRPDADGASGRAAVVLPGLTTPLQEKCLEGRTPVVSHLRRPLRSRERSVDHIDLSAEAAPRPQQCNRVLRSCRDHDNGVPMILACDASDELRLAACRIWIRDEADDLGLRDRRRADAAATPPVGSFW